MVLQNVNVLDAISQPFTGLEEEATNPGSKNARSELLLTFDDRIFDNTKLSVGECLKGHKTDFNLKHIADVRRGDFTCNEPLFPGFVSLAVNIRERFQGTKMKGNVMRQHLRVLKTDDFFVNRWQVGSSSTD
mmetsp:Transcript_54376/g.80676  ORF Transcript_54376/g.80676 Transcript_54376/m.80676 type:complete len:132 (+) Transcript_54376:1692-2087(+)